MESLQPLRQAFERHADTIEPKTVGTARSGRARLTMKAQLRPRVDLIPNNNQRPSYVWQPSHPNAQDSRDIGRTVNRHPTLPIP